MILQALKEYYDRKAADPASGIAPLGWEWKEIPFRVIVDANGRFDHLEDTREGEGNRRRAKPFLVPSLGEAKGNGIKSNLLWENAEYLFGIALDEEKKAKNGQKYLNRVKQEHASFIGKLRLLHDKLKDNAAYKAALRFAETVVASDVESDPLWEEAKRLNQAFILCVAGPVPLSEDTEIKRAVPVPGQTSEAGEDLIRCLVTGEMDSLAKLEPNIKGVKDASTMGAHVVSINNKIGGTGNGGQTPAFSSFWKEQGANSPIGKRASLAYTTALNTLLGKDSKQKMYVGDATTVFWSSEKSVLEDEFVDLFCEPQKDDPDRGVDAVERLLGSVRTGAYVHEGGTARFYVLGLSPNAARIAVRFWHEGTVAEMEERFADWFESLRIVHGPKDREHLSLTQLLLSVAPHNKDYQKWKANIPPNLAGAVMRSILDGTPLPASLLPSAIVRIKAERDITYPRAKLIKAFLNRNYERKLTMSINKDNTDVGYRLGRLFAVLEKIQLAANPGINATIRDRFYASASATPSAVFGNLMRLSGHHLSKLDADKKGLRIWLEKQVEEIVSGLSAFPAHLSLEEQGMFAIGYYHQRNAKKDETPADAATPATV